MGRSIADTIQTILARFLGKAANFFVFALLAHSLTVVDLGTYGLIFTASILISTVCDVGVRNSLGKFIGGNSKDVADFVSQAAILAGPLAVIAVLAIFLVIDVMDLDGIASSIEISAAGTTVALLFLRVFQGALLGLGEVAAYNRTEMFPRVVLVGLTVSALATGKLNLEFAVFTLFVSNTLGAAYLLWTVRRHFKLSALAKIDLSLSLVKRGFPFMLGVGAMLLSKYVTFYIVSRFGTDHDAGLFFGLRRLTEVITEVGLAVSVVLFSRNVREENRTIAIEDMVTSCRWAFLMFSTASVPALIFTAPILRIVLGVEYASMAHIFDILLFATVVGTVWIISFPSFTAIDSPILVLLVFIPNLLFTMCHSFLLHSLFGIEGAAWSVVLSQLFLSASFALLFRIRHGVSVMRFLLPSKSELRSVREILVKKIVTRRK